MLINFSNAADTASKSKQTPLGVRGELGVVIALFISGTWMMPPILNSWICGLWVTHAGEESELFPLWR